MIYSWFSLYFSSVSLRCTLSLLPRRLHCGQVAPPARGGEIVPFLLIHLILGLMLAGPAGAWEAALSDEAKTCLECHAQRGHIITFQNNESIEAYIDAAKFKASVHGSFACSNCHADFSAGRHPQRSFRSKANYQTKSSLACRRCHTNEQIKTRSVHAALLSEEKKGRPTVCTNCHGAHAVIRVTATGKFSSEEEYCMKCHGRSVKIRFKSGETFPAVIDISLLQSSVHDRLACSDCHYGFSSEEHPKRNFKTRRDYTLASSESCRRCHFDKYTKTLESIHYAMLSQGNLSAPVCVDCHGSHATTRIAKERVTIAKRCQRCHPAIYDIYAQSVHGNALFNENNQDVPVCVDCHTAHTIEDPRTTSYHERIPGMCSNCHANAAIVGKYGLSTEVLNTYLSDFHGVTLEFYRMQKEAQKNGRYRPAKPMAVCTDCHGTHNISSTVGPNATIVKANLVKRCQRCHKDANENFPNAWISHYKPSMATAPLVFIVDLVYKILIPVMAVGLALQILLHLWRYVVDR